MASSLRELDLDPFGQQPQRIPIYRDEPEFVDRVRNNQNYPVINNPDGSVSTHRMAAESDANGNWYVFPTIQMQDGKLIEYYDSREAMDAAFKTGNILRAPNKQSALNYAEGAYKRDTGLGDRPVSTLRGLQELSPSDPLYIHQDPMPAGADIMTQQEAISELTQREESARVAGTVTPFESSFNPFNPNFRATAQNAISNMLGGSNISSNPNYLQGRIANTLSGLVDFIPAVGDAVGVGDTITSYKQGDMFGTGINALATGVGVLPLVGGPASKAVKAGGNRVRSALRGIDAWHGSPYEFDSFSTDKIGTGTGLQAYGDGLYFAGNPERAIGYAELTREVDKSLMPAVADFFENDYSLSKAKAGMKSAYPNATKIELDNALNEYYMHLDDQGYMYNVNLNVNPEDLLDSDIPLTDQSEKIRQMAANHLNLPKASSPSKQAYIDEKMGMTGNEFYRRVESDLGNADAASKAFSDADIKGIKYKAGRDEGDNNFVMFDDSLIDTKRVNDKLTDSWMDQGARMQRAQDLDFDTSRTAYRGLSGEYDPSKAGNYQMFTSSPEDASEYGSNVVSSYLRKGNNLVVEGGRSNFNSIPVRNLPDEVRANLHSSVGSVARTDDIAYAAQAAGYDSVSINNVFDKASNEISLKPPPASNAPMSQEMMDLLDEVNASGMLNNTPDVALPPEIPRNYDPTTIDIIFDPKDIRSTNAEFDPTRADSADLLSSISPTQSSLRNIA